MTPSLSLVQTCFQRMPIIGILRGFDRQSALLAADAAFAGGIGLIEVTTDSPGFADTLRTLAARQTPGLIAGAGTVRTVDDLKTALDCGARFIVTPIVDEQVIRQAVSAGVAIFPGAFTPTEIWRAHVLGATAVKVFPAGVGGPDYLAALRGPMHGIKLLPTGGVTLDTLPAYIKAGAAGCGIGGPLFGEATSPITPQRQADIHARAGDFARFFR